MAWCQQSTSPHLNQYWPLISEVLCYLHGSTFTVSSQAIILNNEFENTSPGGQWVQFICDISSESSRLITLYWLHRLVGNSRHHRWHEWHYNDVIMGAILSQITSLTIVYSAVYSRANQRKPRSSLLAFVRGIHRWPVNSPHKWPVTRKMFPFDDVIMRWLQLWCHDGSWHHRGAYQKLMQTVKFKSS